MPTKKIGQYPLLSIIIICALGLCLTQLIDSCSYLFRIGGKSYNLPSLGYSAAVLFSNGSRLVVMLTLPLLGFLVDKGKGDTVLLVAILSTLIASFSYVVVIKYAIVLENTAKILIKKVFKTKLFRGAENCFLEAQQLSDKGRNSTSYQIKNIRLDVDFSICVVIYVINIFTSFSLPYIATLYPDYRVMIIQFSPAFNFIATFMLVFYIDPKFAITIDTGKGSREMYLKILAARLCANLFLFLSVAIVFHLIYS